LIAGGNLDEGEARAALTAAARAAGLDTDANCGPTGIEKTIDSGIRTGGAHPRMPVQRGNASTTLISEAAVQPPLHSDEDLALRFAEAHKGDLRYVDQWGKWFVWKDDHWSEDKTRFAFNESRAICRTAASETTVPKVSSALANVRTVAAVERLAKADRRIVATADQWDSDPDILNTPEGSK
jgi:hypothetical protein